jgi:hypothetical protein
MSARMSKQERLAAQCRWLREQKHRKRLEAEIAKLEKQGEVSDKQLEELGLWAAPLSPAKEFIAMRLMEASPDADYPSTVHRALADLVDSDIPLDRRIRARIAGELRRLYLPDQQRKQSDRSDRRQAEIALMKEMKRLFESRGMAPGEAKDAAAEALGISDAGTWDKKIYRAKRKGIS